jgi:hypothetical protein
MLHAPHEILPLAVYIGKEAIRTQARFDVLKAVKI